ncbi:MAG: right-handed parallel beta-helix repeat-containing protein, partial [Bacteroidetes bacterium]|nr:right-handed parallel beta-helix repeat-containing protein [Bacteroidota bacterium]
MLNGKFLKISYLCVALLFGLGLHAQTVTVSNTAQFLDAIDNIIGGASTTEIILEANTYAIPSTINLTSAHNGIKISGCEGVFINGGVVLEATNFQEFSSVTPGFTLSNPSISNNIKVYDLSTLGIDVTDLGTNNHHGYGFSDDFSTPSMLWLDEEKMDLSRWPDKDEIMTESQMILPSKWMDLRPKMNGAVSYYNMLETGIKDSPTNGIKITLDESLNTKVNSWGFYKTSSTEEIWMDGVVHSSWEWEYNQIADITNGEIKMLYGPNSSFTISSDTGRQVDSSTKVSHFYFENIPEELNTEGEYFIDRENTLLYFYPPTGWVNKKLTLSILNGDMFSISGASGITLENLVIEAGLKNGIVIDDTSSNTLVNKCIIRNFNQWGVRVLGTNNVVDNCEVYNVGGGGVKLGLEKKTFHLTPENNSVQNSTIHNFAWDQKSQVPGVTLSGCANKAIGNEIYDAPHFGVKFRQARECIVENNRIRDLPNYHHFDGGALYLGLGLNFHQ